MAVLVAENQFNWAASHDQSEWEPQRAKTNSAELYYRRAYRILCLLCVGGGAHHAAEYPPLGAALIARVNCVSLGGWRRRRRAICRSDGESQIYRCARAFCNYQRLGIIIALSRTRIRPQTTEFMVMSWLENWFYGTAREICYCGELFSLQMAWSEVHIFINILIEWRSYNFFSFLSAFCSSLIKSRIYNSHSIELPPSAVLSVPIQSLHQQHNRGLKFCSQKLLTSISGAFRFRVYITNLSLCGALSACVWSTLWWIHQCVNGHFVIQQRVKGLSAHRWFRF